MLSLKVPVRPSLETCTLMSQVPLPSSVAGTLNPSQVDDDGFWAILLLLVNRGSLILKITGITPASYWLIILNLLQQQLLLAGVTSILKQSMMTDLKMRVNFTE